MTLIPAKLTTRTLLALSLFFAASLPGQATVTLTEGKQYTKLDNPVKEAPPVVEFFSFYCPACSSFYSPYKVSKNIETILPEGMKVEKYHASFMGAMGKQLTEAWSIAKALGVEDKVEGPLFEAVLKQRSVKSEDDIKAVFVQAGVDAGEFDAARHSFMVKTLTVRQEKAAEEFGLTGTPNFYINGKYQIKNNGIKDGSIEGYGKELAEVVHQLMATNP
ncbi:DsbA family protein [Yersinia enterocolitica]|uniref:DsbA family protein n=1 Tax=Yersinia enterocolitica TaxID=630 RepID=UPI0029A4256F|nr:DsbA family protein [Yersinia enterocolitica]HEI6777231.1 DsbA family protein [Yersinia enterocolitica]HEI6781488.1 DsbA family protein [Yersinia enterocolitica]HEI6785761.1 DsbA family protein [Yersinia enterocolitica]HEI6840758.1 DsbA family protein [Yersinia enterocolitica]